MINHSTASPLWKDACNHGHGAYVGSIYVGLRPNDAMDVYVFDSTTLGRQEVCIRYGNGCNEYLSPGSIANVFHCSDHEPYTSVARLLRERGNVRWERSK